MRWTLLLAVGCARRFPAEALPPDPPPIDAADWVTAPLASGSPFQWAVLENLAEGAAADGVGVGSDDRLSRVASRIAWDYAGSGRLPSGAILQEMAVDAGSPYIVSSVAVEVVPRRRLAVDLYAAHGRAVPGSGLPLVVGVGAWERGEETVLVLVFARRGFGLSASVPKVGATAVPMTSELGPLALLAVDAAGEHLVTAGLPVDDGWVEILGIDGPVWTTFGLMRFGTPAPLPIPPSGDIASGIVALRAAWGLAPATRADGIPDCAVVPDTVAGVEVTRDQRCVALLADSWDELVQRPLALRVMADPEARLFQLAVDPNVTLRTFHPFERLTNEAATARVAAAIEGRWPEIRQESGSPFPELARGWAEAADPALAEGELGIRADNVAARWVGTGGWVRVLGAAQDVSHLLDAAPTDIRPVGYAVGVVLGRGTTGEPMYYAAVGLRLDAVTGR